MSENLKLAKELKSLAGTLGDCHLQRTLLSAAMCIEQLILERSSPGLLPPFTLPDCRQAKISWAASPINGYVTADPCHTHSLAFIGTGGSGSVPGRYSAPFKAEKKEPTWKPMVAK